MHVLLADKLPDRANERLAAAGFQVRAEPTAKGAELVELLRAEQPEVLVVRSTRVERAHIEASENLQLVVRAGAGVNTIDLEACSELGIYVANCPGRNAVAVAELTMGLLLSLDRHLPDNVAELRRGQWDKRRFGKAQGLAGRTLGILGMGDIGCAVARRAQAFQMPVVAWSRSLTDERAEALGVERAHSPEEVAERADALTVHLALTPDTRGRVGASVFRALKPGSLFLNTSRAEVVDEAALREALDAKGIRAGLDVFSDEPATPQGAFEHPLAAHPSVYGTHHIGASTQQAADAVADEACRIIEAYEQTGRVPNCVNLARRTLAQQLLVVRHRDRVGVLAAILELLREASLNVEEMENVVFDGGKAACARIPVGGQPDAELLRRIRDHEDVFSVHALSLSSTDPEA